MATFIQHKNGWLVQVRRKGHESISRTFNTKAEGERWSLQDARIASGLSGSTVTKDLALLSHAFTIAIKEWGFPLTNPVTMIRKPKADLGRDRRLNDGEEQKLLDTASPEMRAFIIIAIETAIRRCEIHRLKWSWIRGRVAYLPDTKNGSARAVPLSVRALAAINSLPLRIDGRL